MTTILITYLFAPDIWGTVSDWVMIFVTLATAALLLFTLKSQKDVQQITIFEKRDEITSQNDIIETYILDHLFSIGLLESHGFDGGDVAGLNSGTIYALNCFGEIMKNKII